MHDGEQPKKAKPDRKNYEIPKKMSRKLTIFLSVHAGRACCVENVSLHWLELREELHSRTVVVVIGMSAHWERGLCTGAPFDVHGGRSFDDDRWENLSVEEALMMIGGRSFDDG